MNANDCTLFFAALSKPISFNIIVQLIQVDWPLSVLSLFDWVRFFSFSINVVRPECAFAWKFQTKVLITLLTPISLSLLTLFCGFIYGMFACFQMWKVLEKERRASGKYVRISYLSVLSCWYYPCYFRRYWADNFILGLMLFCFGM
jgi:hypothetical protein